jgi:hypothetical protein
MQQQTTIHTSVPTVSKFKSTKIFFIFKGSYLRKDLQYLSIGFSMGDSSYKLNFDQGKKNEIQHHS